MQINERILDWFRGNCLKTINDYNCQIVQGVSVISELTTYTTNFVKYIFVLKPFSSEDNCFFLIFILTSRVCHCSIYNYYNNNDNRSKLAHITC